MVKLLQPGIVPHRTTHEIGGSDEVRNLNLDTLIAAILVLNSKSYSTTSKIVDYVDLSVDRKSHEIFRLYEGSNILFCDWNDRIDLSTKEILVSEYVINKANLYDRDIGRSTYAGNVDGYSLPAQYTIITAVKWDLGSVMDLVIFFNHGSSSSDMQSRIDISTDNKN